MTVKKKSAVKKPATDPNVKNVKSVCPHCSSSNVIVEIHPELAGHKVRRCLNPACKKWDALVPGCSL